MLTTSISKSKIVKLFKVKQMLQPWASSYKTGINETIIHHSTGASNFWYLFQKNSATCKNC